MSFSVVVELTTLFAQVLFEFAPVHDLPSRYAVFFAAPLPGRFPAFAASLPGTGFLAR